jgi:hypothetical protein
MACRLVRVLMVAEQMSSLSQCLQALLRESRRLKEQGVIIGRIRLGAIVRLQRIWNLVDGSQWVVIQRWHSTGAGRWTSQWRPSQLLHQDAISAAAASIAAGFAGARCQRASE